MNNLFNITFGALFFYALGVFFIKILIKGVNYLNKKNNGLSCFENDFYALPTPCKTILLGQVFAVIFVYLFSLIFNTLYHLRVVSLKVSYQELRYLDYSIILLLIASVYYVAKEHCKVSEGLNLRFLVNKFLIDKYNYYCTSVIFLLISFCLISYIDLPLKIAYSTDPDQHAFWANQIKRYQMIPWIQYGWGNLSFQYPAQFATLNYLWTFVSGLQSFEIVTIQEEIQFILGIGILYETIFAAKIKDNDNLNKSYLSQITNLLLLVIISFQIFKYPHWAPNSTNTAQNSLFGYLALLTIIFFIKDNLIIRFLESSILALIFNTNPVHTLFPALILFCKRLFIFIKPEDKVQQIKVLLMELFYFIILIFIDPYLFSRLFDTTLRNFKSRGGSVFEFRVIYENLLSLLQEPFKLFESFYNINLIKEIYSLNSLIFLGFIIITILTILKNKNLKPQIIIIFASFFLLTFIQNNLLRFANTVSDSYLLAGYTHRHLLMISALPIVFIILSLLISVKKSYSRSLLILLIIFYFNYFNTGNIFQVKLESRKDKYIDFVTVHTDEIFKQIDTFSNEILNKEYKNKDSKKIPKILVLNAPTKVGIENWLFPIAGGRILPLYQKLPLAFYYFQGSSEWNYENYMKHVCQNLDLVWLKERNIRWVFIPENHQVGCIRDREKLFKDFKKVFQVGETMLIDLTKK